MSKIMDLIRKIGGKEPEEEYTPRQLIDRHLDSLRRQRQFQMNELEREQLKKEIGEYNRARERKYLWGMKDKFNKEKKQQLLGNINKRKVDILKEKKKLIGRKSMLNNKREEFKRRKVDVLRDNSTFMH